MCVYRVSFQYVLPLACYNDKQFYKETLPEAICCCLQECLLLILIPLIFMHTKLLDISRQLACMKLGSR